MIYFHIHTSCPAREDLSAKEGKKLETGVHKQHLRGWACQIWKMIFPSQMGGGGVSVLNTYYRETQKRE
jgi:hypothetical protein